MTSNFSASAFFSIALFAVWALFSSTSVANSSEYSWERSSQNNKQSNEIADNRPANGVVNFALLVDNFLNMFEDYEKSSPTMDALAIEFGNSPEAAFEYIRDRIRSEPYVGTLRRPASVLAASGGNPQDKAELLMHILRKMGLDARIAAAPMTEEISQRLLGATCSIMPQPDKYVGELMGMTKPSMQQAIIRARRDYGLLFDAASSLVDASQSVSSSFGETHYWVQYRAQDGWRDLDPSVPELLAGEALAKPKALSEGGIDPHMVTISVVTETLSDGKLSEQTVLTHEMSARDADTMPIQLGFVPANAGVGGVLSNKLGEVLNQAIEIKPVLMLEWEPTLGKSFPQPGRAPTGGVADSTEEKPVTAVYLDIQSIAPEGHTRNARRVIVDLIPIDVRGDEAISLDLIEPPEMGRFQIEKLESARQIIVSNGGLDPMDHMLRLALIISSTDEISSKILDGTIKPESMAWIIWTSTHGLATGAERVTRNLRSTDGSICAFMGHANVMIWGFESRGPDQNDTWIDWTIDGVDLASRSSTPDPKELAAMRFWYGAVRSAIETEVLAPLGFAGDVGELISTSTQLDGPLVQLSPEATKAMDSNLTQRDLDEGYVLFGSLTPQSDFAAWWRVDPQSGAADARLAKVGNGSNRNLPGGKYVSATKGGIARLGTLEGQLARGEITNWEYKQKVKLAQKRAKYFKKTGKKGYGGKRRGGHSEYTVVQIVGAGLTMAAAGGVGYVIYERIYAALFGETDAKP